MIEKDFIEDRFLWCYFSYDDQKYNEQVWDKEINTLKDNPKKKTEIEFKNQFFMCYDLHNKLLYLDDCEKCGFIKRYIQEVLQKYTIIKGIYSSIEEFEDKINDIIDIKFIQFDNVMNR